MPIEYKLEQIDWDKREKQLAEITKYGWEPIAISKVESMTYYLDTVIILFKRSIGDK
jgi:hypothetical protein